MYPRWVYLVAIFVNSAIAIGLHVWFDLTEKESFTAVFLLIGIFIFGIGALCTVFYYIFYNLIAKYSQRHQIKELRDAIVSNNKKGNTDAQLREIIERQEQEIKELRDKNNEAK